MAAESSQGACLAGVSIATGAQVLGGGLLRASGDVIHAMGAAMSFGLEGWGGMGEGGEGEGKGTGYSRWADGRGEAR